MSGTRGERDSWTSSGRRCRAHQPADPRAAGKRRDPGARGRHRAGPGGAGGGAMGRVRLVPRVSSSRRRPTDGRSVPGTAVLASAAPRCRSCREWGDHRTRMPPCGPATRTWRGADGSAIRIGEPVMPSRASPPEAHADRRRAQRGPRRLEEGTGGGRHWWQRRRKGRPRGSGPCPTSSGPAGGCRRDSRTCYNLHGKMTSWSDDTLDTRPPRPGRRTGRISGGHGTPAYRGGEPGPGGGGGRRWTGRC